MHYYILNYHEMNNDLKSNDLVVLRIEINNRIQEIEKMSNFLEKIEKEKEDLLVINSIKSGLIIMLYNIIEYFITELIKIIEDDFKKNKYKDFTDEFKSIFLSSFVKHFYNITNEKVLSRLQNSENDFFDLENLILYWYSELEINTKCIIKNKTKKKNWKWISWNIDYEAIKTISDFFWFNFNIKNNNDKDFLKDIRNYRNELSHWNKSFNNLWQDLQTEQIIQYKDKLNKISKKIIKEIDNYLEEKPYLIKNKLKKTST